MKNITNTTSREIKKLTPDEGAAIVDLVLEEYGDAVEGTQFKGKKFDDLNELYNRAATIGEMNAKTLFKPFIGNLLEKVLMSTLKELPQLNYMNFIDLFRGRDINKGASIEFLAQQIGGYIMYERNAFIPQQAQYKNVISQVVSLTSTNFKQVKIPLTINVNEIQYYFVSKEKITEFLNTQREALMKTHTVLIFNEVMKTITGHTYAKTVTGTATNMFDSIIEVTNIVSEMTQLSGDFNMTNQTPTTNNLVTSSKLEDLVWIWSLANENSATMGIKSQLFNRDLWSDPITEKMIKVALKNRYDLSATDPSAVPTKNATDWVNNNTIYVINKDAISLNYQLVDVVTSQYYAENMLLQININCWFLVSTINFGQGIKYTNPNLSVQP